MKKSLKKNIRGFSLIEFIVVITIFSIMSAVSIFNYNQYVSTIEASNIAQDIAITIRQAQVYGLSGSDDGVNVFDITRDQSIRGVNFSFDSQNPSGVITLYEDFNRNNIYDLNSDRILDQFVIASQRVRIIGFDFTSGTSECNENNLSRDETDISFQRPYPDAFISYGNLSRQSSENITIYIGANCADNPTPITVNGIGNIGVK